MIIGVVMAMTSSRAVGPAGSPEHNVPAPLTSLVGRTPELGGSKEAGPSLDNIKRKVFEVQMLVAGDLTGVLHPA